MALPGRVIKIDGELATIDYGATQAVASIAMQECEVGDWVIVNENFVQKIVPEDQAVAALQSQNVLSNTDGNNYEY